MNQWGGRREPFLFGVDFELTGGFFIPSPLQQQDVLFEVGGVTNAPRIDFPAGKVFIPHPVSGKEYMASNRETAEITNKIYIRFRSGIKSTMRIKHGDRIFEIESVLGDKRSGMLTIMAREVA